MQIILDMPAEKKYITAEVVASLLKPSCSVLGSNRRPREESMVVKFREFLQCVQSKWAQVFVYCIFQGIK